MSRESAFAAKLRFRCDPFLSLSEDQVDILESHYSLLCRWNRRMNLTTITELGEVVERHYAESLFAAARLPAGIASIADIGSGAGFPGLPIAAVRSDLVVVLVEANKRKAAFLREASDRLPNLRVRAVRSDEWLERVDCLVSRAVRWEDVLARTPANAQRFLLMLGEAELQQVLDQQGFEFADPIRIPWGERRFLLEGTCST